MRKRPESRVLRYVYSYISRFVVDRLRWATSKQHADFKALAAVARYRFG